MVIENGKFRFSRSKRKAANRLGVTSGARSVTGLYRRKDIEEVQLYLRNEQYDHLQAWDAKDMNGNPIPLRSRKPTIVFNLAKRLSCGLASKLLGPRVFPELELDDDPLTKELVDLLVRTTGLKSKALDMSRDLAPNGSGFMRFKFVEGMPIVEKYNSNICYPEFDPKGELLKIEIKYVFCDHNDLDDQGHPKKKWFKMELGQQSDIMYDNPEFVADSHEEPVFQVVGTAQHGFGFVQGEWFKTADDKDHPDGPSLIHDVLGFIDAFNYSVSQSDQAVRYNQEPQLFFKQMDKEEMEELIRSSMTAWNLGRDGEAGFLDNPLTGVERASELRDKFVNNIGDITRVMLHDPEKLIGSAQSAKAMEILHGPLLDLIDEMRPFIEKSLIKFIQKLTIATVFLNAKGVQIAGIDFPAGYRPQSLDFVFNWPAVFPMTMSDLQQKVSVAAQATQSNLVSRFTMTKWLAKDFGIEDIEAEVNEVNTQEKLGGFGFF